MRSRVRLTAIGGIVIVLAVIAVIWFAVLSPRMSEAAQLDEQATTLETANLGLQNQYNRSLDLARQAPEAALEAQRLFAAMPQQAELPRVLEQITQAALDAGIDAKDVQTINTTIPAPVAPEGATDASGVALAQLQVSITATGGRAQALQFLDNLQALDRILLVTSSRLTAAPVEGAKNKQAIQVTGTMFVLQSELPDLVKKVDDLLAEADMVASEN